MKHCEGNPLEEMKNPIEFLEDLYVYGTKKLKLDSDFREKHKEEIEIMKAHDQSVSDLKEYRDKLHLG